MARRASERMLLVCLIFTRVTLSLMNLLEGMLYSLDRVAIRVAIALQGAELSLIQKRRIVESRSSSTSQENTE